jgi:DNA-nicking Smr family endonuclease
MSGTAGGDGDGDETLFQMAMRGVRPLRGRGNPRTPNGSSAPRKQSTSNRPRVPLFTVELEAEIVAGRSSGTSRARVAELARGEYPIEQRIDLHGLTTEAARGTLQRTVVAAGHRGVRCLLVIHGRGRHSENGASALRETAVAVLTTNPCAALVRAFVTARRRDGGAGALYVLLGK